jgi:hypothetical protein
MIDEIGPIFFQLFGFESTRSPPALPGDQGSSGIPSSPDASPPVPTVRTCNYFSSLSEVHLTEEQSIDFIETKLETEPTATANPSDSEASKRKRLFDVNSGEISVEESGAHSTAPKRAKTLFGRMPLGLSTELDKDEHDCTMSTSPTSAQPSAAATSIQVELSPDQPRCVKIKGIECLKTRDDQRVYLVNGFLRADAFHTAPESVFTETLTTQGAEATLKVAVERPTLRPCIRRHLSDDTQITDYHIRRSELDVTAVTMEQRVRYLREQVGGLSGEVTAEVLRKLNGKADFEIRKKY